MSPHENDLIGSHPKEEIQTWERPSTEKLPSVGRPGYKKCNTMVRKGSQIRGKDVKEKRSRELRNVNVKFCEMVNLLWKKVTFPFLGMSRHTTSIRGGQGGRQRQNNLRAAVRKKKGL